ncbi:LysR family transcriptional regulator [Streptomyces sp. NPDC005474]|uniref:helix-turn-helix domain-containing protein n=1 Tax=Streptomyces sp. NPDC005474 TaxID=3154878 RepID=UPI003456B95F
MEATALRQLAAYTAVAWAASFTAATAEMHVSQSSLSHAGAHLGRQFGVQSCRAAPGGRAGRARADRPRDP